MAPTSRSFFAISIQWGTNFCISIPRQRVDPGSIRAKTCLHADQRKATPLKGETKTDETTILNLQTITTTYKVITPQKFSVFKYRNTIISSLCDKSQIRPFLLPKDAWPSERFFLWSASVSKAGRQHLRQVSSTRRPAGTPSPRSRRDSGEAFSQHPKATFRSSRFVREIRKSRHQIRLRLRRPMTFHFRTFHHQTIRFPNRRRRLKQILWLPAFS